ncbi:hypothetical protein AGMMS49573_10400 [Endomicrobiia bacterium]|uniref:hypothetical protein n=1 Tax=Endomicrobium trichonymphae TaxID=1408204 RepID=UPI00221BE5DE|nr:hypothetical protein AGMMS49573_10400 [Endomicrobiia bacterium]GMO53381.1 MAG: hypothetical protein Ta2C_04850 [Candidatus Endomicrobium trichonymphae]
MKSFLKAGAVCLVVAVSGCGKLDRFTGIKPTAEIPPAKEIQNVNPEVVAKVKNVDICTSTELLKESLGNLKTMPEGLFIEKFSEKYNKITRKLPPLKSSLLYRLKEAFTTDFSMIHLMTSTFWDGNFGEQLEAEMRLRLED